jgi:hypothetical protein
VLVALPSHDALVPGVSAEIAFQRAPRGELSVPLAAVVNPGGARPAVFVAEDGRARRVAVEVMGVRGERVAVRGSLDGEALADGDLVITAGLSALIDGDAVMVRHAARGEAVR